MKIKISIIICTYNRSHLLKKCLDSLLIQNVESIEIIVIDNNSQDETSQICAQYVSKYNNVIFILETIQGLSHARNRGYIESKSDYVLYIDDDAIAFPNLVERALYLVNRAEYDCVGGMYYSYYYTPKPKWIPADFGTKQLFSEKITNCPFNIPSGGIVLYRKSMLKELDGFSSNFGMIGEKKWLGEETELQFRAEKAGYKIAFDPVLKIYHLVKPEYTKLSWFLKRPYLEGKAIIHIYGERNWLKLIFSFIRSILGLIFRRIPTNLIKLIFTKDYFWQNFVIDCFRPNLIFIGKLMGNS